MAVNTLCVCPVNREESEAVLKKFRMTLEEERAVERERLEAQNRQDIERLKAEFEEELQAERSRLQGEREEKLNSLKHEVSDYTGLIFNVFSCKCSVFLLF